MLTDERIDNYRQTSWGCPEQYEGELTTGEFFFFYYRHGCAELYLSWQHVPYSARNADAWNETLVGDSLSGIFESGAERNETFKKLLDELDACMS